MTPVFVIFDQIGSIFYSLSRSDCPFLSAVKLGLSLSHLVPEIVRVKIGVIFYQNVFKHFVSVFSPCFQSNWSIFSLILDLFDLSFLHNLRSDWVLFFRVLNRATDNLVKYPLFSTPREETSIMLIGRALRNVIAAEWNNPPPTYNARGTFRMYRA